MKAVIMAGGKGTRLSEITKNEIPKALAEVAGKPLLWHQIWRLKENGIIDITLVVGHLKEKIISYLGNGEQFGVHVHYIEDDILLGTAGALYYLKNEMADDFLLLFGDIVFDVDIERMVHFHKKKNAVLTLYTHPNSYPYDSDLVMFDKDHRVTAILKKTDLHPTFYKNCVNASFFIVNPRSLAFLKKPEKMDMEKDFVSSLVRQGERVYAYHATEYLKDAGTPERIASASRDIQDGVVSKKNLKNEQECIFLDRDGTLNKFVNFLSSPAELELLPGVAQAVK
jgi:NDP-sugar pyrophosphorylase family protein